jgi:aspartate kinase
MKVLKFGGTSLGDAERIRNAASIVRRTEGELFVVLSANGGVTDELLSYAEELKRGEVDKAMDRMDGLEVFFRGTLAALVEHAELHSKTLRRVLSHLVHLRTFKKDLITVHEERVIGAHGEILSSLLFEAHLQERGEKVGLLPALDTVRLDAEGEADHRRIRENWEEQADLYQGKRVVLTQGFIGRDDHGLIADLGRGGSDHTATLFGAALEAKEVQIWTDIDGIHNNDPREVSGTFPVPELSYEEAAELAYFGAKVLHPTAVAPAKEKEIPIRLLNSFNPSARGTLIERRRKAPSGKVRAIAAKDGITGIRIRSGRMLMAYGFLKEVFAIFEKYRTPIDMISTSEVAVSLTIDDTTYLDRIVEELERLGAVDVAEEQSIVCVVGDHGNTATAARIFEAIGEVPLRMISYGGSMNNISFLVDTARKREVLELLQEGLFAGGVNQEALV